MSRTKLSEFRQMGLESTMYGEVDLLATSFPLLPIDVLRIVHEFASERLFHTQLYCKYVQDDSLRRGLSPSKMRASWHWELVRRVLVVYAETGFGTWEAISPYRGVSWCLKKLRNS